MSPSLLSKRLGELEAAGVLVKERAEGHEHDEYRLTRAGEELRPIVEALGTWGKRWISGDLNDDELDVELLMWDMRRRIDVDRAPPGRTVVEFEFPDLPRKQRRYWLVVDGAEVDLCWKDPGYEVDLTVSTDLATMTAVWRGDVRYAEVLRRGELELSGPAELRRSFPEWLGFSLFAGVEMPAGSPT